MAPSQSSNQLQRMAALAQLELLQQPGDAQTNLNRIVRVTEELLPADGGASVVIWSDTSEEFLFTATTVPEQLPEQTVGQVRKRGGATRWILDNRRPYIVEDTRDDPLGANPILKAAGLQSYIGVPLLSGPKTLGVLYAHAKTPRKYSAEDVNFMIVLAGRAATAILNDRLFGELQHMVTVDQLTGLHTKAHFMELAENEISRAVRYKHPLAVLFIDVDFFKEINDSHGHLLGDLVLEWVGRRIRENFRGVDILGRYGGEEFVVMLVETAREAALMIAERLRRAISRQPVKLAGNELSVSISIGVSSLNAGVDDLAAVLTRADAALYRAKKDGRDCVRFQA